jgi:diacylglycerol kinase family enzyme
VVANARSGTNVRDREAVDKAAEVLGAELIRAEDGKGLMSALNTALAKKPRLVVSAGGDGTTVALASKLLGSGTPMGVLPLGTFNYFARGEGLSQDPVEAAEQIASGKITERRLGMVNDQVFLNNASIGVYPWILKEREDIYKRFGRRRLMAHWSVVRTFLRFKKPMRVEIDGEPRRTPLVFVGRSAFQLERFGLQGAEAVRKGGFAVLVVRARTRAELFHRTARMTARVAEEGVDYDLYDMTDITLDTPKHRQPLLAYDGEKMRMKGPLRFHMSEEVLRLVVPA